MAAPTELHPRDDGGAGDRERMTETTSVPAWLLWVSNLVERLFWTFLEAFATFAIAQSALGVDTTKAALMAGVAAALNLVLAVATDWTIPSVLPFGLLVVLRLFRTLIVSVLTIILTAPTLDLSGGSWKLALIASFPALLAVVKSLAASRTGGPNVPATPALLPTRLDPLAIPATSIGA